MGSRKAGSRLCGIMAASVAGFATLAVTQSSRAQNLLLDPSFEEQLQGTNGVGGWSEFAGAGFSQTYAHTGSWSMYTPDDGGGYIVPGAYQIVPVTAGQTYALSGYVYTPNTLAAGSNDYAILQLSWFQTPTGGAAAGPTGDQVIGDDLGTPAPPAGSPAAPSNLPPGTWTYGSITGVAPAGAEGVGVYLLNIDADSNADFYFDDVSLTASSVPEPATIGLAGLAAIPLLRRRRRS